MEDQLVMKQERKSGQVDMQQRMVTMPLTFNSDVPTSIRNGFTLNKSVQNGFVTSQHLASAQPAILPNVQILNMRPRAPTFAAQNSVATVPPTVVFGTPQVFGARAAYPGITQQTLQNFQQQHQSKLLLKTGNGQYQLLRVGPTPTANNLAVPQAQTLTPSTVPEHSRDATISTSVAALRQIRRRFPNGPVASQVVVDLEGIQSGKPTLPPTVTTQKTSGNIKGKCRNFFTNLLNLSSTEPSSVEKNVRNLIQNLIDAQVEPEVFCNRLERLLNASSEPCLIGFLKKSLPLLRQSLVNKELVIEGINPPATHVAFSTMATPTQHIISVVNRNVLKSAPKTKRITAVLQNTPIHAEKNSGQGSKTMAVNSKASFTRTPGLSVQFSSQLFVDYKMAGDDEINDVAAMGGVNVAEETQRILGCTEMIGTKIRSCKDEFMVPMNLIQARIKEICLKHGLNEPSNEVTGLLSHAVHERLKNLVKKLTVIAQHRIDLFVKTDNRYEMTKDTKGQLKFLEERDSVMKKRREDIAREMLLRAANSRSKTAEPEQRMELKAKAKEMHRVELEEVRQRETNLTALQAIGPRKKLRLSEGTNSSGDTDINTLGQHGSVLSGMSQLSLRKRIKRICHRDMIILLEQEKETAYSMMLYRSYMK